MNNNNNNGYRPLNGNGKKRKRNGVLTGILVLSILLLVVGVVGIILSGVIFGKTPIKLQDSTIHKTDFRKEGIISDCEGSVSLLGLFGGGTNTNPLSAAYGPPENTVFDYCNGTRHNDGSWTFTTKNSTLLNPNLAFQWWQHHIIAGAKPDEKIVLEAEISNDFELGNHPYSSNLIHPFGPGGDPRLANNGFIFGGVDYNTPGCENGCLLTMCFFFTKDAIWAFHDSLALGVVDHKRWSHFIPIKKTNTKLKNKVRVEHNRKAKTYEWFLNDVSVLKHDKLGFMIPPENGHILGTGGGTEFTMDPSSWIFLTVGGSGAAGAAGTYLVGGPEVGLEPTFFIDGLVPSTFDKGSVQSGFSRQTEMTYHNLRWSIEPAE